MAEEQKKSAEVTKNAAAGATDESAAATPKAQAENGKTSEPGNGEPRAASSTPTVDSKEKPNDAADQARGAENRESKAQNADGEAAPLTNADALRESALAARNGRNDGTLSPSSESLEDPGPELRSRLTTDALAAQRERLAAQAADGVGDDGEATTGSDGAKALLEAWDDVMKSQDRLNEAMIARDAARDRYDRLVDRQSQEAKTDGASLDYVEAMNRRREASLKSKK